jgi:hypothetical protein
MGKINYSRVLLGGLLAGVIINIVEFVLNGLVFQEEWAAALAALGKSQPTGVGPTALVTMWGFLVGMAAVWLYAAIRPRFGPGPKTALYAGLAIWVLAYLSAALAGAPLELFPRSLMVTVSAVGMVEAVAATVAGAWIYREEVTR